MAAATDLSARDVAAIFGCSTWTICKLAREANVGMNLGGSAGWRFTTTDVDQLRAARAPKPTIEPRRTA